MNKINYQQKLDALLRELQGRDRVPTLLLHSCCAPCSSYVIEYLSQYFAITVFYYNPNITEAAEYQKRVAEQKRLLATVDYPHPVTFIEGEYDSTPFWALSRGKEDLPEGGERCRACYRLRLEETARQAAKRKPDFFCSTLSVSPHKRADWLNEIGEELAEEYGVAWLPSDFKKRGGYQRSIVLSHEYNLYRQNYCGCVFSRMQAEKKEEARHGA